MFEHGLLGWRPTLVMDLTSIGDQHMYLPMHSRRDHRHHQTATGTLRFNRCPDRALGLIEETISLVVRLPWFLLCLATGLCFAFAFLVRHVCGIGVPVLISGSACLLNRADCDCFWFCLPAESGFP